MRIRKNPDEKYHQDCVFNNVVAAVAQDDWDYCFAKYGQVLVQAVWVVASAAVVAGCVWANCILDDAEWVVF